MLRYTPLLLAFLWTPTLCAQSLNIDIGSAVSTAGGTPATEPGAADQPGHWNLVGNSTNYSRPLRDLQDQATTARINLFIGSGLDYDHPGAPTGGAGSLLNDFMAPSTVAFFTFQGLEPGTYEMTTYAWAPDFVNSLTSVSPSNSYDKGQTNVGGNSWNGDYQEGVTHTVHTIESRTGNISVTINEAFLQSTINGFQLKKVAEIYETSCFGDGGVTPGCTSCPCGNDSFIPEVGGCRHSANGWDEFAHGTLPQSHRTPCAPTR